MIISWSRHLAKGSALGKVMRGFGELSNVNWRTLKRVPSSRIFTDDLYFNHDREPFLNVIKAVRENPNHTFSARAVAYFLYNMSEIGVNESIVQDLIERYVARFRGNYTGRVAFGALAGGLKLNYKPSVLRTFAEDYIAEIEKLTEDELIRTYEAFFINTSLPLEERLAMVKGSLEPEIEKRWKKLLFSRGLNYYLAMSMAKLKTVDTELCLRTVKSLTTMHSVGLSKLVDVFKAFSELGEEIELSKDLQTVLQEIRTIINSKKDSRWTYNTEELRDYTYEELYGRRDQIRYPGQMFPATMSQEKIDNYNMYKKEGEEAERMRRAGQDVTNIASTMTDEELLEVINLGGVAMTNEDLDKMVQSVGADDDEPEEIDSRRSNKPQKKPSRPKFGK